MTRDELLVALKESPEWVKSHKFGCVAVETKPDEILDSCLGAKKFFIWARWDSYGLIAGFAATDKRIAPKKSEYRLIHRDTLFNWLSELELTAN